jgi:hypothetical protein
LLALRVETFDIEDRPVPQQRLYDLIVVNTQIIDTRLCNLRRFAGEPRNHSARHRETHHLIRDRSHGRARRHP